MGGSNPRGLGLALGEAHRHYSSVVYARLRVTGHLFQTRYGSVAMDETHLAGAKEIGDLARIIHPVSDFPVSDTQAASFC